MTEEFSALADYLQRTGWSVRMCPGPAALPANVASRFDWIPSELREFIEAAGTVVSPDERSWFVTSGVLSGTGGLAFAWNEWELLSLAAAEGDEEWRQQIRDFWDRHFPLIMSVKSGYAFFAVRAQDRSIVCGEEPEFEETTVVAASVSDFLTVLRFGDMRLSRWV